MDCKIVHEDRKLFSFPFSSYLIYEAYQYLSVDSFLNDGAMKKSTFLAYCCQ